MAKVYRVTGDTFSSSLGHLVRAGETVAAGHPMLADFGDRVEVADGHVGSVTYPFDAPSEPVKRGPGRPRKE